MSEPKLTKATDDTAFFGHPRGLKTLFFTEMWERFSYYGMRAILFLFMTTAAVGGGLGFDDAKAGMIYGIYTALVYMLSLPGGWIADRFMGQQRAVLYGGVLIMIGHICLAVPSMVGFYLGLFFVTIGTGLLKPNISTIVGQLYTEEDRRRDSGFALYYMGINLGAWLAPLVCGFLAQSATFREWTGISVHSAWHFGFAAAAVGMFFGLIQYMKGRPALGNAGREPVPPENAERAAANRRLLVYVLLGTFGLPAVIAALGLTGAVNLDVATLTIVLFVILVVIMVGLFVTMFAVGSWTSAEKRRLVVVMLLCVGATILWADFEQAGSTFNAFADRYTDNHIFGWEFPSSWLQQVNSIFVILFAPVFAALWTYLAKRGRNPSSAAKFSVGMFFLAAGCLVLLPAAAVIGAGGRPTFMWLVLLYLLHTFAELLISPVGLSSMTKLAPSRIAGLVMGMWFAAAGLGNYIAGVAAGLTAKLGLETFLLAISVPPIVAGILFAILVKPLKRMLGDAAPKH